MDQLEPNKEMIESVEVEADSQLIKRVSFWSFNERRIDIRRDLESQTVSISKHYPDRKAQELELTIADWELIKKHI